MYEDTAFSKSLLEQTTKAISAGSKAIVIWGFNEIAIGIIHFLNVHGQLNLVSAIVDPDPKVRGLEVEGIVVSDTLSIRDIEIDTIVITSNQNKEEALRLFSSLDKRLPKIIMAGTAHLKFRDPLFDEILLSCHIRPHAFGYENMLIHIYQSLLYIARNNLEGNLTEFGVYKAGTTVFIAKVLERLGVKKKIYAFDTFAGFPVKKSVMDMYNDPNDEFSDYQSIVDYCSPYDIELIKGDISETYTCIKDIPLVFTFFDTDNYSPTRAALQMCYDQTIRGGILAFDHYFCDERWLYSLGERIAIKEILDSRSIFNLYGTGIFLKL